jgi:hypothetical protein
LLRLVAYNETGKSCSPKWYGWNKSLLSCIEYKNAGKQQAVINKNNDSGSYL